MYGEGSERSRQRGTAAHNTVQVAGLDSSEVWGGFRVARRARPVGLVLKTFDSIEVVCAHDGYRHLSGRPMHERRWSFAPRSLLVTDRVSGPPRLAEAHFLLHPSVSVETTGSSASSADPVLMLRLPRGQRVQVDVQGADIRLEAATWHPEFGQCLPSKIGRAHV